MQPENVKPWQFQDGHAGGPGRPSFRDIILRVGSEIVDCEGVGRVTRSERLVRGAIDLAENGKDESTRIAAFKFIATHTDGAKLNVENSGVVEVRVSYAETSQNVQGDDEKVARFS